MVPDETRHRIQEAVRKILQGSGLYNGVMVVDKGISFEVLAPEQE